MKHHLMMSAVAAGAFATTMAWAEEAQERYAPGKVASKERARERPTRKRRRP